MISFCLCIKFIVVGPHLTFCLRQDLLVFYAVYARLSGPPAAENLPVSIALFPEELLDCRCVTVSRFKWVQRIWAWSPCLQGMEFTYKVIFPALCFNRRFTSFFFYTCFVFMSMCVPCVCLIPEETRGRTSNPLILELFLDNWEPPCDCREISPGPRQKQ